MKKIYLFMFLSISSMFVSPNTSAESLFTECDSCSASMSFYSIASNISSNNTSTVFVGNFQTNTLKKYMVRYDRELGQVMLFNSSPSSSEVSAFRAMKSERDGLFSYLSGPGLVPESVAASGYDLVGRTYLQNQVLTWYQNNQSIKNYVENYAADALNMLGHVTGVQWNIEVKFADGTSAWFKQTMDRNYEGLVKMELSRVVDKNGNEIPLKAEGFEGQSFIFELNSSGMNKFLEAAERVGAGYVRIDAVVDYGNNSGNVTITELVCTISGGGLVCSPKTKTP